MMAKAMYTGIRILQSYITPVAILWGGWEGLESPLPPQTLYVPPPGICLDNTNFTHMSVYSELI